MATNFVACVIIMALMAKIFALLVEKAQLPLTLK